MTASCLACKKGVTAAEYCKASPKTEGCKTDAPATCDPKSGPSSGTTKCPVARCVQPAEGCTERKEFAVTNGGACCAKPCNFYDRSGAMCGPKTPTVAPTVAVGGAVGGCAGTRYGCCDDKTTAKKDLDGANCEASNDKDCCLAMTASCLACKKGVTVEAYCKATPTTQGCSTDGGLGATQPTAKMCPAGCASWSDGCNTCRCTSVGVVGACTERQCVTTTEPKCLVKSNPPIADGTRPVDPAKCDVKMGPTEGNCPVAKCMAPPTGCRMVREFARTSTGCCPKQCNYKDAAGKSCTSTTKPPVICGGCTDKTLRCLACHRGVDADTYCKFAPETTGCTVTYPCTATATRSVVSWAPKHAKWCCDKEKIGCEALEEFNCRTREVWTADKKKWCCEKKKIGCTDTINCFTKEAWPQTKKDFCCKEKKVSSRFCGLIDICPRAYINVCAPRPSLTRLSFHPSLTRPPSPLSLASLHRCRVPPRPTYHRRRSGARSPSARK